ncbi:MAG: DUF4982 domain-containing protein [Kiritimatiellae bacterium]|nr:DUF4982 domain-containing protein [Kiritimatiellia bacterium]
MNALNLKHSLVRQLPIFIFALAAGLTVDSGASECSTCCSSAASVRVRLATGWRAQTALRNGDERQFTFGNMEAWLDGRRKPVPTPSRARAEFKDDGWPTVRVPHDRGLDRGFACDRLASDGFTDPAAAGWYRRTLDVPAAARGKRVFFACDGAMSFAMVWINGHFVGGWPYGYSPWRVELTPYVDFGGTNVLAVRTAHVPLSSRFYVGAGLQRDCFLEICDGDHLVPDSVAIRTELEGRDATVTVTYEMSMGGRKERMFRVENARLWDVDDPYLHSVEIEGETFRYGIRTFGFFADARGFQLNGRRVPIRGVCLHQDFDVLGNAWNESACRRRLLKLKEVGCNAIRMSHYRHPAGFYDLCDELGFLVMDETFDQWNAAFFENDYHRLFPRWHERDLRAMVRANRNHPSIVLWGVGNEIPEQRGDLGGYDIGLYGRTGKALVAIVREEDPTRPVTTANNNAAACLLDEVDFVDVYGFNYCCGKIAPYHAARPDKPTITTETGCYLATRGEYYFDLKSPRDCRDLRVSSYLEGALRKMDEEWMAHEMTPSHVGGFYWTGFDYLGGPGATPLMRAVAASVDPTRQREMEREIAEYGQVRGAVRACPTGLFDLAGFPRDVYWQFKARWCPDEPTVHLLPHWNWPERVGKKTPVVAFTSGDEVELFVNGVSQGRRKVPFAGARTVWPDVAYQPGAISAVAYRKGVRWAETKVETTGPATHLALRLESDSIVADGESVAYVNVDALDAEGRLVPRTRIAVDVDVRGGELVGVENGDETDLTGFRNREHVVFNGHLSVVVRAKAGSSGKIDIGVRPRDRGIVPAAASLPIRTADGADWVEKFYPGLEASGKVTFNPTGYRGKKPSIELCYLDGAQKFGVSKDVTTDLKGVVEWAVSAQIACSAGGKAGAAMEFFDAKGRSLGVKEGKATGVENWKRASWSFTSPKKAARAAVHLLSLGKGRVSFADVVVTSAPGVDTDEMPIDVAAFPAVWNKDWNGGMVDMLNFSDAPIPAAFLFRGDPEDAKDTVLEVYVPDALELKGAFCPNAALWGVETPASSEPDALDGVKCVRHRFENPRGLRAMNRRRFDCDRLFGVAAVIGPRADVKDFCGTYPVGYRLLNAGKAGPMRRFDMKFRPLPRGLRRSKRFLCFSWNNQERYFPPELFARSMPAYAAAGVLSFRRNSKGCNDFPAGREIAAKLARDYPKTVFSISIPNFWGPSSSRLTKELQQEFGVRLSKTIDAAHAHSNLICPQFYTTHEGYHRHLRKVVDDILTTAGAQDGDWVTLDQEPWECQTYCFCDECLKAFAAFRGLGKTPTIEEARSDPDKWADFRTMQSMKSIQLVAEMIHAYNPKLKVVDYDYVLDYGNAAAERAFRRNCAKDALKNEKWLDGHLASYYHKIGKVAFDAMKNNARHLRKPYCPMAGMGGYGGYLRPGEVLTPKQFRQFALAAFVNGCPGYAVYSGVFYDGRHLLEMMRAQDEVAAYEHLPWGRADGPSRPTSKSSQFAFATVVGADGRETVALFNYDADEAISIDLNGETREIGPNDVVFATGKQANDREVNPK